MKGRSPRGCSIRFVFHSTWKHQLGRGFLGRRRNCFDIDPALFVSIHRNKERAPLLAPGYTGDHSTGSRPSADLTSRVTVFGRINVHVAEVTTLQQFDGNFSSVEIQPDGFHLQGISVHPYSLPLNLIQR